jgi:hypothetical protein
LHDTYTLVTFLQDFVDFVGLESSVHLLVFIRTIIRRFISQPKVSLKNKKKFGFAVCELKSMGKKGVIVYIRFIKVV